MLSQKLLIVSFSRQIVVFNRRFTSVKMATIAVDFFRKTTKTLNRSNFNKKVCISAFYFSYGPLGKTKHSEATVSRFKTAEYGLYTFHIVYGELGRTKRLRSQRSRFEFHHKLCFNFTKKRSKIHVFSTPLYEYFESYGRLQLWPFLACSTTLKVSVSCSFFCDRFFLHSVWNITFDNNFLSET